jgi:putative transposon-encoded protein
MNKELNIDFSKTVKMLGNRQKIGDEKALVFSLD